MRLTRYHRDNLIAFTIFLLIVLGVWFALYQRSKAQIQTTASKVDAFGQVLDQLVNRPTTPEELLNQKNDKLALPYRVCYYNNPNDPSLWYSDTYEITPSTSIVRMTRPIPIDKLDPCTGSTTPLADLRTDLATINEGYNPRADEIIILFLENLYSGITIEKDTLVKNLNYSSVTSVFQLSVACVYRNAQSKYDVLINQFGVAPTGELSNDPPQALDKIAGVFSQINRKGVTRIRDDWTLYAFFSGRSTSTNTVEIFLESGYNKLVGTLALTNTEDKYIWVEIPVRSTILFFRVSGPGTMQLDRAYFYLFPTNAVVTRTNARYVLTASEPPPPPPPPPALFSNISNPPSELTPGQSLRTSESIISPNREYALIYQADGNLVLRSFIGLTLWSANTTSPRPSRMVFKPGGIYGGIELFDENNQVYWAGTSGYWPTDLKLRLTNDGKLQYYYLGPELNCTGGSIWTLFVPTNCEWITVEKVTWSVP